MGGSTELGHRYRCINKKLIEAAGKRYSRDRHEICTACLTVARRKKISDAEQDLECSNCGWQMPLIQETIEPYWRCFTECDSQLRASGVSIFGLDWNVVIRVAEIRGIEVDERFILYLKTFEETMIENINKRSKKDG